MDYKGEAPDLILWASSLEHNTKEQMRALYLKSMEFLTPGGTFLATIPISSGTYWHKASKQTNLSPQDAAELFDEYDLHGFEQVQAAYRHDRALMTRYEKRYG